MTEVEKIIWDAWSLKHLGYNQNPTPSKAWFMIATDQEIADWQSNGDSLIAKRRDVSIRVSRYTEAQMEEDSGVRHRVDEFVEHDLEVLKEIPITAVTMQETKRSSGNYLTRCLWHNDSHPSCVLFPAGRGFWCPVCNKAGSVIDWVMEEFGLTFVESLDFLEKMK